MFTGLESPVHLLILLLIILLLFGAKRLPEMGRSLGKGIQEFKAGLSTNDEPERKEPEAVEERANAKAVQEEPAKDERSAHPEATEAKEAQPHKSGLA